MRNQGIIRICVVMVIALLLTAGYAAAVRPTSALYDQTGLTTTIDATCVGTLIVNHDLEWDQTNKAGANMNNNTLLEGETRGIYTYRENTLATGGTAKYTKEYTMDGGNVSAGRDNLDVRHTVQFQAIESMNGVLLWDEQGTLSLGGSSGPSAGNNRCVFATDANARVAGFNGYTTAGASMNVQEVAAITSLGARATSASASVPVNLRYTFDAQGLETDPNDKLATGSASVYANTHFETYDTVYNIGQQTKPNLTTYIDDWQETQARGLFDLAQTVGYTSTVP